MATLDRLDHIATATCYLFSEREDISLRHPWQQSKRETRAYEGFSKRCGCGKLDGETEEGNIWLGFLTEAV